MENKVRAEVIAALVTDKYSGFKDGDEAILEACSDTRLEEFRATSEARKVDVTAKTNLEKDVRNTAARLKVAEERIKASEQELSEEEFLLKAPTRYKTLIERAAADEAATRDGLVSRLKDCGANTEEELKKKSLEELKTLAAYARVPVPDFSGKGMPTDRHAAERVNYAPPSAYAAGLKQLQGKN